MDKNKEKLQKKIRRHSRVRSKISGTKNVPRLSVFRSNMGMQVQLIDDVNGVTLLAVNSKEIKKSENKVTNATELGKLLAQKAKEQNIDKVVFDKGGYQYHGRVKALAEGAREGGLKF